MARVRWTLPIGWTGCTDDNGSVYRVRILTWRSLLFVSCLPDCVMLPQDHFLKQRCAGWRGVFYLNLEQRG